MRRRPFRRLREARLPPDAAADRGEPLVYQDWAEAKVQAGRGTTWKDDPTLKCLLPGVPRIFGMPMPFEILQTPKHVAILYESFHGWRLIPFNAKHDDPDLIRSWAIPLRPGTETR